MENAEAQPTEAAIVARRAAEIAVPFADQVATRCASIAGSLRQGDDGAALTALGESTEDLEHFLRFLVLIQDFIGAGEPSARTALSDYQRNVVEILEGLQPALGAADLVEIADTLEDDLVPALKNYRGLDDVVQAALAAAA